MAFWGCSFVFDGIPCEDYDLMMYESFNGAQQDEGKFANTVKIVEDKVSTRWKPYFYGAKYEDKLSFSLVFGVNQRRLDANKPLDRSELEAISTWLVGHQKYKWLEISQEDIEHVRFRCIVTSLEIVEFGSAPWALKAVIECDGPYAYMYPRVYEYDISKVKTVEFYNESSHPGFYKPYIEVELGESRSFSITNITDGGRTMSFNDLPSGIKLIKIDNDCCVVMTDESGINLYPFFNFKFFRLAHGVNSLVFEGDCKVRILCEFPVNTGS